MAIKTKMEPNMNDCIFCKIIDGSIPAQKIYEDDFVLSFKDIQPQARHHYLVIPKKHITSLAHIQEAETQIIQKLYDAALKIVEIAKIKEEGFRTVINTGKHGGQTVFHLHLHILSGAKMKAHFGQE